MKTRLTELLGIRYPIIQGAMAWISCPELVAAVSEAGGAGVLTTNWGPEQLRKEIHRVRELTDKPFGVNTNHTLHAGNAVESEEVIQVIIEERVNFVTMGAGDPRPYLPVFKEGGVLTIPLIPNTRLAKRMESCGADAIIIEGMESGGRIGTMTTMSLMENVIPEIRSIPVIAAGGIVDGRGIAAALVMGADGVQMGSRFMLAKESIRYDKSCVEQIIQASDEQCITTGLSRNKGMRGLRSPFSIKYTQMEISGVPTDELNRFASQMSKKVAENGLGADGMNGIIQVGQSVGPLKKVQPAAEIINELVTETTSILNKAIHLV